MKWINPKKSHSNNNQSLIKYKKKFYNKSSNYLIA